MARQLRIEYPGAFCHVTSRGNEQKVIFKSRFDQEKFLLHRGSPPGYLAQGRHYPRFFRQGREIGPTPVPGISTQGLWGTGFGLRNTHCLCPPYGLAERLSHCGSKPEW